MKLKCDFVTNSSSCSYTVYGIRLTDEQWNEMEEKLTDEEYDNLYDNETRLASEERYIGLPIEYIFENLLDSDTVKKVKSEIAKKLSERSKIEIKEEDIEYINEEIMC